MGDKKVIWITGASSGIGKALTIKFASNQFKTEVKPKENQAEVS